MSLGILRGWGKGKYEAEMEFPEGWVHTRLQVVIHFSQGQSSGQAFKNVSVCNHLDQEKCETSLFKAIFKCAHVPTCLTNPQKSEELLVV